MLSLVGIYINLKENRIESLPEYAQESLPSDDRPTFASTIDSNRGEEYVSENLNTVKFDEMGNKLSTSGDGLTAGSNLINTKSKNGGAPGVRLADFAGASALKINNTHYGADVENITLKNPGLPFNVFPEYQLGSLEPISSRENVENQGPFRTSKVDATLGQIYTPSEDFVTPSTFRQPTLSHNKLNLSKPLLQRTNKLDVSLMNVDRKRISERNSNKISRVLPDTWEVSDKPNFGAINATKDFNVADDKESLKENYIEHLRKIGPNTSIIQMTEKM